VGGTGELVARGAGDMGRDDLERAADGVARRERVGERARDDGRGGGQRGTVPSPAGSQQRRSRRGPGDPGDQRERHPADEPSGRGQRGGGQHGEAAPLRGRGRRALPAGPHDGRDDAGERGRHARPLDRGEQLPHPGDPGRRRPEREHHRHEWSLLPAVGGRVTIRRDAADGRDIARRDGTATAARRCARPDRKSVV